VGKRSLPSPRRTGANSAERGREEKRQKVLSAVPWKGKEEREEWFTGVKGRGGGRVFLILA